MYCGVFCCCESLRFQVMTKILFTDQYHCSSLAYQEIQMSSGLVVRGANGLIIKIIKTFIGKVLPNSYFGFTTGLQSLQGRK